MGMVGEGGGSGNRGGELLDDDRAAADRPIAFGNDERTISIDRTAGRQDAGPQGTDGIRGVAPIDRPPLDHLPNLLRPMILAEQEKPHRVVDEGVPRREVGGTEDTTLDALVAVARKQDASA